MYLLSHLLVVGAPSVFASKFFNFCDPIDVERVLNLQLVYVLPVPSYFGREICKLLSVVLLIYLLAHFVSVMVCFTSRLGMEVNYALLGLL